MSQSSRLLLFLHLGMLLMPGAVRCSSTQELDSRNPTGSEVSGPSENLEDAVEEQVYYLQQLFLHYGSNGTLTYNGLQKLLGSLGLGEVSMLEIRQGGARPSQTQTDGLTQTHTLSEPQPVPTASPKTQSKHGLFGKSSILFDHPTKKHLHGHCLNVTQLLWNFGLGSTSHITPSHFTFLCPALLYQIDSGVCLRHSEPDHADTEGNMAFLKAMGWSCLALTVISLPSLLALGLAPLLPPACIQSVLCPLAALAVGTLCGDALLHLLPHATSAPHNGHQDSILKGLSVLGGIFLLFLVESLLALRQQMKKRKKKQQDPDPQLELCPALQESSDPVTATTAQSGHGHSHGSPGQDHTSLGSLVWMVVMGDGIHNITDGLAIGVAFSQSLAGGLSTSVAVLCHELPHELGDLAVLLAAGWPMRRLAVFSVLSSALGFLGVLMGTLLGVHWAPVSSWVLTLTAGVFLYVALVDMMPEMLHGDWGTLRPLPRLLLQVLGLMAGGTIMLAIALGEEHLSFNLVDG
ncbi:zinc transporter ZIP10-like [Denticeps clupeoides]|uniref:Solute carrier family 39 member 5 n=1 Tax=Denticeps clupeoides TaxID=299321 RepID=A0AAY4DE94_9TELE|nr:zinc transporter ZIP10-like [Denticeps clupeoides]XP_028850601.1 zinc transporter ZIP10-like [Denticeps clupeoides]XP_028850654.1 zinc transporter ZIP10-like [Denticeps clupeoides]XP_028850655.1 zinc transporter ZIP10-like [Denticeps clupeoides]